MDDDELEDNDLDSFGEDIEEIFKYYQGRKKYIESMLPFLLKDDRKDCEVRLSELKKFVGIVEMIANGNKVRDRDFKL